MGHSFVITGVFIALFALLQVPFTVVVGLRRLRTGILFADGGDVRLLRLMRAHGNFTETVPITLLAMAAAEARGAPGWLLVTGGGVLLLGRSVHYASLLRGTGDGLDRAAGMVLTFLVLGGFGLYSLLLASW
jgi:uncharacterized membrane protein YecN with MAPEG domain